MSRVLYGIALVLVLLTLNGCSDSAEVSGENTTGTEKHQQELNALGEKYGALIDWDETLDDAYTYKVQKTLTGKKILVKDYWLSDIYEEKGKLLAKFEGFGDFYLIVEVDPNSTAAQKLTSIEDEFTDISFVADIERVTTPSIFLDPQAVDEDYIQVEVSMDTAKILYGKIIDVLETE